MDKISDMLAKYTKEITYDKLSNKVVHEIKRRVLDSLACAFAAYKAKPVILSREISKRFASVRGSRVLGTKYRVAPDWATFVDGVMIRYHDFNDTYHSKKHEPLHPSDMIATALSIGDVVGADGKSVIATIAIGYEVAISLSNAGGLRKRGWDHPIYEGVGSVLMASKLLELDDARTKNALAIYATSCAIMRQSRVGRLSMWKGSSAAYSMKNAVFATLLASEGFTGPEKPFEGNEGFINQLLGGEFDYLELKDIEEFKAPNKVLNTHLKAYPVLYCGQTAVDAALKLRNKVRVDEIDEIVVETINWTYKEAVKDPEKWDPYDKETADHSLPWIIATTLIHGPIKIGHYKNIRDRAVLSLIKKTRIKVDEELDKKYPYALPNRIAIKVKSGKKYVEEVDYAKGHIKSPMSNEEIESKFNELTYDVIPDKERKKLIEVIWNLEKYTIPEIHEMLILE